MTRDPRISPFDADYRRLYAQAAPHFTPAFMAALTLRNCMGMDDRLAVAYAHSTAGAIAAAYSDRPFADVADLTLAQVRDLTARWHDDEQPPFPEISP